MDASRAMLTNRMNALHAMQDELSKMNNLEKSTQIYLKLLHYIMTNPLPTMANNIEQLSEQARMALDNSYMDAVERGYIKSVAEMRKYQKEKSK
jgi:hypothetical protein